MSPDERHAWLRLLTTPGLGPARARQLLQTFGLPSTLFATPGLCKDPDLARLLRASPDAATAQQLEHAQQWLSAHPLGFMVTLADPDYPAALFELSDPPLVLFGLGRRHLLGLSALAIVGSRHATQLGAQTTHDFAGRLAQSGLCIISGMASGIDTHAHQGALDVHGDTIAVLGSGIDQIYPKSNAALYQRIASQGLLLSEYLPGTPVQMHQFPRRNRLIAGLAKGVLVVEAALQSGSLITARLANELGREVFAIPGSIHSPLARGCHRLIRDGAKLVESAQDVLEELRWTPREPLTLSTPPKHPQPELFDEQKNLLRLMAHAPIALDLLAAKLGLTAGQVSAHLLQLELSGLVERLPGNRFQALPHAAS